MESCDSVVKITVGGKDWYYQRFYDDDGREIAVRLYDSGGDFVREYSNIYRLTGSLGAMMRKEKEKAIEKAKGEIEKQDQERWKETKFGVSQEEKDKTQKYVMQRVAELKGEKTAGEFADITGISGNTINVIISGIKFPSAHVLKRIADRCGVSVDWILGRTDEK